MTTLEIDKTSTAAIVSWNRLEGSPRAEDFDRSLRAEVRDALWMLCRQWQFGEFQGEDAGSAMLAKTQIRCAYINRFAGRSFEAVGYNDALPLEIQVEREPVPLDLMTRARLGLLWLKLIAPSPEIKARYIKEFGFHDPSTDLEQAHVQSDRQAWQTLEALKGRGLDGIRLLEAMGSTPDAHAAWLVNAVQNPLKRKKILEAAKTFKDRYLRIYSQPASDDSSTWAESYLEYQFACALPADKTGEQQDTLVVEQYHQGQLDWYSFQLDSSLQLSDKVGAQIPPARFEELDPLVFLPTPIEFQGMPNVRWWRLENGQTNFGQLKPSTSDLASLVLAEFGLVYGNDWSLVPYRLPVGTLSEVLGIVVTDTFGVRTFVRPAVNSAGDEHGQWGMYYLSDRHGTDVDRRLFLPPVLAKVQERVPLEKVVLMRDEMANLVMAIEQIIPGTAGDGIDGHEAAAALEHYFQQRQTLSPSELQETGTTIRYRLGTHVYENWIPFIAVKIEGSNREIKLQRAAMPRVTTDPVVPIEPRGAILRSGLDQEPRQPYFLHEEEVPRTGVVVTRNYQRARWWNGKVYTWLGRQKGVDRVRGASGLEFDKIIPLMSKR